MGLLDTDTEEGQRLLGLLAAAGPQTDPTKTGFAARMLMANDGLNNWKKSKQDTEFRALQMEAQKKQWAQLEEERAIRIAQHKNEEERRQALGNVVSLQGGYGGASLPTDANGMPIFSGDMKFSPVVAPKLALNQEAIQKAIQLGADPKTIAEYANLQNLGKQKVARTIKGLGPDGREYEYQKDDYGNNVGDGVAQFKAPHYQDTGGSVLALDPYTNKPILSIPKTQTPDGKASNALGWANYAVSKANSDRAASDAGKPQIVDGQFVYKPDQNNPQGKTVPIDGFNKPLNDVQAKAQLFGTRMQEADKIMRDLAVDGKVFSTPGTSLPIVGGIFNGLNTEHGQMLDQAKRDFLNAVLRRESGAVISPTEFDSAAKQYFPQIGEGEKVIKQKERARQIAIQGILAEVPSGSKPIDVPQAPKNVVNDLPKVAPKGTRAKDTQTGQVMVFDGLKWKPE